MVRVLLTKPTANYLILYHLLLHALKVGKYMSFHWLYLSK